MTMRYSALVFIAGAIAFSQTPAKVSSVATVRPPASVTSEVSSLKRELATLKEEVENLRKNLELSDEIVSLHAKALDRLNHETAELDPASPGRYQRIETGAGSLLISMGKVEPYLDGFKATISIGNPFGLTFEGFGIAAYYGPRWPKDGKFLASIANKTKLKNFSFTDSLYPARWKEVELIFPSTVAADFGRLSVSVEVNTVSLGAASKTP